MRTLVKLIVVTSILVAFGFSIFSFREKPMEIIVTKSAAETGIIRVWLRETPDLSETVYAFRVGSSGLEEEPIAEAKVYGRGIGSQASEQFMLMLRPINKNAVAPLQEGEKVRLLIKPLGKGEFENIEFDILQVE